MPTYVIYARKSSEDEDRQVLSIGAQVSELEALAGLRGIVVSRVFEESQSARRPGRPKFNEMMELVDKRKIDGVLCWKPDRLARNMVDGGRVIDALDRAVLIEIISPGRSFRNTSDDKFMLNLDFSMSKKYVDDLSDNVRRGNRAVLQSGRTTGVPPIGYLKEAPLDRLHGRGAGRTVKDPVRYPLVAELFRRFLTGAYSVPELTVFARDTLGLRSRGTRRFPPGPVCMTGMYFLLRNSFYAGFLKHGGEVYRGDHDAVVTKKEFDRVQTLIRRHDAPRPQEHAFLFRGFMRCGSCGRVVVGEEHWNRRYGIRYVYYRCGRKRLPGSPVCTEPYVRQSDIERGISQVLARLTLPQSLLDWTFAKIDAMAASTRATSRAVQEALERERSGKERELERLLGLYTRGVLSETEYVNARMAIFAEISRLDQEIKGPGRQEAELDQELKATLTIAASAEVTFRKGDESERRELLGAIAERIVVKDRKPEIVSRRPYHLLAVAADEYRARAPRDPNHQISVQNQPKSLSKASTRSGRNAPRRHPSKQSDPNHLPVPNGIEKTTAVEAVVSSWWTSVLEVRTILANEGDRSE